MPVCSDQSERENSHLLVVYGSFVESDLRGIPEDDCAARPDGDVAAIGTTSSVGGPMTDMLIVFVAMLAVGIQQAILKKRSGLGWIVNIVAAVIGGLVGLALASMAIEAPVPAR